MCGPCAGPASSSLLAAALLAAMPAAAGLRPVNRDFGELQLPRVRAGTIEIPADHGRTRITVLVRLAQPPLAPGDASAGRSPSAARAGSTSRAARRRRTSRGSPPPSAPRSPSSGARSRRRACGAATGSCSTRSRSTCRRRSCPALVRQPFATRVYPSFRYRLALDRVAGPDRARARSRPRPGRTARASRSPSSTTASTRATRSSTPTGYQYPAGFPKGGTRWTTPKVIVARAFPGPNSGRPGRLALDPEASFHGTHVAGIAAGQRRHERAARARIIPPSPACRASRRAPGSATTASSTCRRRSATSPTRRRSSPRSSPRSRTAWT